MNEQQEPVAGQWWRGDITGRVGKLIRQTSERTWLARNEESEWNIELVSAMGVKNPHWHLVSPAQEAPESSRHNFGHIEKAKCDKCRSDNRVEQITFDRRTSLMCGLCRGHLLTWMSLQLGTPYAGPERLQRPKLAHSMGPEDPALEDA